MYNINCFNWNKKLPIQYIWENTCGLHALRNSVDFFNILIQVNNYNNRKKYLSKIESNINFLKLISDNEMNTKIKKYQKFLKKKGDINKFDFVNLINNYYKLYPIQIIYNINETDLILKNKKIVILIIYREELKFSKHWIPIIIHKIENEINFHILDSFNSTWYGDKLITDLINKIKNDNKYLIKENCNNKKLTNFTAMIFEKILQIIYLTLFIFILVYSSFHN